MQARHTTNKQANKQAMECGKRAPDAIGLHVWLKQDRATKTDKANKTDSNAIAIVRGRTLKQNLSFNK